MLDCDGAPFFSIFDSLSERTANWLGDRNEVVASLGAVGKFRFRFGRWPIWNS